MPMTLGSRGLRIDPGAAALSPGSSPLLVCLCLIAEGRLSTPSALTHPARREATHAENPHRPCRKVENRRSRRAAAIRASGFSLSVRPLRIHLPAEAR